jgi:hypothetical protein
MEQPMPTMPKPRTAPPHPISPYQQLVLKNQQLELNQRRQEKRDKAVINLDIFQTDLLQRASDWMIGARQVGKAYKTADNFYRETLDKKKASDNLEIQIFFSILTVVTSGALGWISVAASKAVSEGGVKVEDVATDARDAILQAVSGEAFSANGPLLFPPTPDSTVSQDPQNFQSDLENKVDCLRSKALLDFNAIRMKYRDVALSAWDNYAPETEETSRRGWQKMAKELAGKDDLPPEDWMARELERSRWAKYVLDNHSYRDFGIFETADGPDDVGSDVRNRLKELRVTAAVAPTGGHYRGGGGSRDLVVRQLWNWAKNYEPRKFTDEKKNPGRGGPDHQ